MIRLTHYDDRKEKSQSHEISLDETPFYNAEHDVSSHNVLDIVGYGKTKEEALENFKKKFTYVMAEWRAFEKMLLETDMIEDNMSLSFLFLSDIERRNNYGIHD